MSAGQPALVAPRAVLGLRPGGHRADAVVGPPRHLLQRRHVGPAVAQQVHDLRVREQPQQDVDLLVVRRPLVAPPGLAVLAGELANTMPNAVPMVGGAARILRFIVSIGSRPRSRIRDPGRTQARASRRRSRRVERSPNCARLRQVLMQEPATRAASPAAGGRGSSATAASCRTAGSRRRRWGGRWPRLSSPPPVPGQARGRAGPDPPRRTVVRMSTSRPRPLATLATTCADATTARPAGLLHARPDLLSPVPSDIASLAARATTRPSVQRALDLLDRFILQVLDVLVALPEPADDARCTASSAPTRPCPLADPLPPGAGLPRRRRRLLVPRTVARGGRVARGPGPARRARPARLRPPPARPAWRRPGAGAHRRPGAHGRAVAEPC